MEGYKSCKGNHKEKGGEDERKRLESEKLQELRSIRIQKLTKQGRFLPEEDYKFLERTRVVVEEEEHQALAAADTTSAKNAITNALVSEDQISVKSGGKASEEKN